LSNISCKTNTDYISKITEKQEQIIVLNSEIEAIQKVIEEQNHVLKEKGSIAEED